MIQLSGSAGLQIKSGNGVHDNVWSDVEDCIPLKKRLKMLLESKRLSDFPDSESEKGSESPSAPPIDAVKTEDQQCDLQGSNPSCFARDERNPGLSPEQSHTGVLRDYIYQGSEVNDGGNSNGIKVNEVSADTVLVEKVDTCASTSTQCSMLSKYPVKVGVGYADNNLTSSLGNGVEGFLGTHSQAVKIKTEIAEDFVDDLDYVVLKERRRLLLSRKSLELKKPVMDINFSWFSSSVVRDTIQNSIGIDKKENHSDDAESSVAGSHTHDVRERNASDLHKTSKSGTELQCSALVASCQGTYSAESGVVELQESDRICSSKKASTINESCGGQGFVSCNAHSMLTSALPSTFVNIKAEPMDYGDVYCFNKDALCNFPSSIIIPVKSELEILGESCEGNVDHMLLRDRIKLLASREAPNLDSSRNFKCSKKIVPSVLDCSPIVSRSAKPLRINRSRKRRKTATASVETALEEDAPGLLQVLIDKGVLINEIKLYGETENEEGLDDSSSEDNFSELEAVISKLFSQRQSLLKFAPIRCTKGEKASYCLACLISLVEQARYLQFRKWPVEWGWCRDLQSFIFVFKRHNRIVLERPEYGYATYFFELIDSLPIHWQIKRLVTAMKLTSCSRVTLIENKALLVGEDLSEGEARVLMEYGWIPNSGLGTMLNYCDRVVHDRKNESDVSEWRSKIGKLLMNGYDGGTIVSADIPKVVGCCGDRSPQIKLEL